MALSIGQNFNTGIVSGAELERVSREIFGASQTITVKPSAQSQISSTQFPPVDRGINLFAPNTDIALTKQVAGLKSGYDVEISQNALSSINSLNSQAAILKFASLHKQVEGKIYIPVEKNLETMDLKMVFAASNAPKLFNTKNLESDRKGSNPFNYVPQTQKAKKTKSIEENLSIFA
jgi:hypothetical protein